MFAKLAQDQDLTLSTASSGGCPWQQHMQLGNDGGAEDKPRIAECLKMKKDLYERVLPELDPDVVVVVSRDYLTRRPGVVYDDRDQPIPTSSPDELASLMKKDSERSLAALREVADRVVIVEPVPIAASDADPFTCLSESEVLEACRFVANQDVLPIESIYRDLADNRAVWAADFDKLACPFLPICDPVVDGRVTRFDYQHLAPAFAVDLADEVATYLQEAGIIGTA